MTTMYDDKITEGDLLSELAAQLNGETEERLPGDITISELVERTGRNRQSIADFLKKQVDGGILERHWISIGGHGCWAFHRRAENKKPGG